MISDSMPVSDIHADRFSGVGRVLGPDAVHRLAHTHVCVIGIGGVGSWAVEALARSGVGEITLIDMDDICLHNINRQIHATTSTIGKLKVEIMAERIQDIHPACKVNPEAAFLTSRTADELLRRPYTLLIDAIDRAGGKARILADCRKYGIPAVTVGGAGGKKNPTAIQIKDLSSTSYDPLLFQTRKRLRRMYGFPRDERIPFGIPAIYSPEQPIVSTCDTDSPTGRLDCAGSFGSLCTVTAIFGFLAAHAAIQIAIS